MRMKMKMQRAGKNNKKSVRSRRHCCAIMQNIQQSRQQRKRKQKVKSTVQESEVAIAHAIKLTEGLIKTTEKRKKSFSDAELKRKREMGEEKTGKLPVI